MQNWHAIDSFPTMSVTMNRGSRRRSGALLACLVALACATTKPGDVVEYRHFPAYDTYLPITRGARADRAEAGWVLRAPGNGEYLEAPASAAEAERRVRARASFERRQHAKELARDTVLFPVMVLASIAVLPLFILLDPIEHQLMEKRSDERRLARERFAGVPVRVEVRDPMGTPIPGARLWALTYPEWFGETPADEGRRSFAEWRHFTRMPTPRWLELETRHLPLYLGHRKTFGSGGFDLGEVARDYWPLVRDFAHRREDEAGTIRWVSEMYEANAEHTDEGWRWKEPPSPRPLVLHVWAPGYAPAGRRIEDAHPGREVAVSIELVPRPDASQIQALHRDFDATLGTLDRAIHPMRLSRWRIDHEPFRAELRRLEDWAADDRLPGYFRWNALRVIESLAEGGLTIGSIPASEARTALARARRAAETLSPYLDGEAMSPWSLRKGIQEWTRHVEGGLQPHEIPRFRAESLWVSPIPEARELLAQGERIDPEYPRLGQLRAALALDAGDRESAVRFSRYMGDDLFFQVFHDGLQLEMQWAPSAP